MKTKMIVRECCPYCQSKDIKSNGIQQGMKYDMELATCQNKDCDKFTFVIARIQKSEVV